MSKRTARSRNASPRRRTAPPPPPVAHALAALPQRAEVRHGHEELSAFEKEFGWPLPQEARRFLVATAAFDLVGGAADVLALDGLRAFNAMGEPVTDAIAWTTRHLGLLAVAVDAHDDRFCIDVLDEKAPVYLVSPKYGMAASAAPVFPMATEFVQALALYTAGAEARRAERDVEQLTAELEDLRKRRPNPVTGRSDALARLEAAFGGKKDVEGASPTAEEEARVANALDAARERHKQLWMPFIQQFARWPMYWNLLWNGPRALSVGTDSLDAPLNLAWRSAFPLGQAIAAERIDALRAELADRVPQGRAAIALARARVTIGDVEGARTALQAWEGVGLGVLPPLAQSIADVQSSLANVTTEKGLEWGKLLGLSKVRAEKFLAAVGAQLASDLKKHGTTNILGATKAAVRPKGDGTMIVEAGLGHVPLEVRKALFEGKPVALSGQFLRALTTELTRRLHEPKKHVEKVLGKLRGVLEAHLNAHATFTIPHVASFRVRNEPAPTGAPRFYLIVDVDDALKVAAQQAKLHHVSAGYLDTLDGGVEG